MSALVYQILHVGSGFLLVAVTFQAFAAPSPERRRATMILGGILSLLMLTGGFGLMAKLSYAWEPWIFIKIACWLVLSAMAGIAFRKPAQRRALAQLTAVVVLLAVWAVYMKPSLG